jgi:predicted transcriptional regulator
MAKPKQPQSNDHFDFDSFQGFANPTTTPTPDLLFDHIMQDLNESELKVLLYIIRRTYGFKKNTDDISINQLVDGIKTKDGKVLDRGTGLSKSTVKRALQSLKEKNLIDATQNQDPKRGNLPTTYSLKMNDTPRPASGPRGGSPAGPGLAHQRTPQQTVKQQTVSVVVKDLIDRGISAKVAHQLAGEYTEPYLYSKIELFDYLVEIKSELISKNPAGYLRKAISENYVPPKGFKTKEDREKGEAEERQLLEQLDEELRAEREELEAWRDQVIEAYEIPDELLLVWKHALDELKKHVSQSFFDEWFSNTFLLSVKGDKAIVGVESQEAKDWLTDRAKQIIATTLTSILGDTTSVEFEVLNKNSN